MDSPKDGKLRRKVTPPSAFEEDVVDGITVRSFTSPEAVQAYVSSHATQQAAAREKRKHEQQQQAMRLQQKQHMERFQQQQRIQQAEDEKARKRMRRMEDRKYPESDFITEHAMESMVPSPTYERSTRAKSDSDSDYEPSVAKKRRRQPASLRTSRRPQSQQFSGSSSSDDDMRRPGSAKQSKLPAHHVRHPPHAHGGSLGTRQPNVLAQPPQQHVPPASQQPQRGGSGEGYTHMSREAIAQYNQVAMAQSGVSRKNSTSSNSRNSDQRPGAPAVPVATPPVDTPPALRSSSQFAINPAKLFDKPYPLPQEEIHWPILHVAIANRIKQHKAGGCEAEFAVITDTLPQYLPRPSFVLTSGTVPGTNGIPVTAASPANPQLPAMSSHGSSTSMHSTAAYAADHHGPPATAPALPNVGDPTSLNPRNDSPNSPITPNSDSGKAAASGSSQLRERLEKPPAGVRSNPHSPVQQPASTGKPAASPAAAVPPAAATATTTLPATAPQAVAMGVPASSGKVSAGSPNTLMSVDRKSLVLIEKKPMVGIKTSSGIHYIEVTVEQQKNPQSGKVLVRPTNPLSAEHLAALSNPVPASTASGVSSGATSPVMSLIRTASTSSGSATPPVSAATLQISATLADPATSAAASSAVIPAATATTDQSLPAKEGKSESAVASEGPVSEATKGDPGTQVEVSKASVPHSAGTDKTESSLTAVGKDVSASLSSQASSSETKVDVNIAMDTEPAKESTSSAVASDVAANPKTADDTVSSSTAETS